jgi:ATP-dependent Lon protease
VREKVLAAKNFGVKRVLLPKGNEAEARELRPELVEGIDLRFVDRFEQLFDLVYGAAAPVRRPAGGGEPVRRRGRSGGSAGDRSRR